LVNKTSEQLHRILYLQKENTNQIALKESLRSLDQALEIKSLTEWAINEIETIPEFKVCNPKQQ
jgi:hypothetical protein